MTDKEVLNQKIENVTNIVNILFNDIENNKPHATTEYVLDLLTKAKFNLETAQNYLAILND